MNQTGDDGQTNLLNDSIGSLTDEQRDQMDIDHHDQKENEGFFTFLTNCWSIYERKTLALIALQYVNEGGSVMLAICCTLYMLKQEIEPTQATYYMCIIVAPEALAIFWGTFAESVSIYGKRGHIILAALLQLIMSIIVAITPIDGEMWVFVLTATLTVAGKAWMTPSIEALMIV